MKITYQLKLTAINKYILIAYTNFLNKVFQRANIDFTLNHNPIKVSRLTLLKSPHVYKKAKEQFELRKYSVIFSFLTFKTQNPLKFIQINKPKEIKSLLRKIA